MLQMWIGATGTGYKSIRWIVWKSLPFDKPSDPKDIVAEGESDTWIQANTMALKAILQAETRVSKR